MNKHPHTAAILAMSAMALSVSTLHPPVASYMMGHYGHFSILSNGKSRKKKSNKLHHSRMLCRKHRKA